MLPVIGAALGMLGRGALSAIGGSLRLTSALTAGGLRSGIFRALGRSAARRRAVRKAGRRSRRNAMAYLLKKSRKIAGGRAFTRRGKKRRANVRRALKRYRAASAAYRALPSSAPAPVRARAAQAISNATSQLQSYTGLSEQSASGGGVGVTDVLRTFAQSASGVASLGTAAYAASRSMEMLGRQLAQVNGSYAATNAQLDVSRLRRSMQTGYETQDSYKEMIRSVNNLDRAFRATQVAVMNLVNGILTTLNDYAASAIDLLNRIAGIDNSYVIRKAIGDPFASALQALANSKIGAGALQKPPGVHAQPANPPGKAGNNPPGGGGAVGGKGGKGGGKP